MSAVLEGSQRRSRARFLLPVLIAVLTATGMGLTGAPVAAPVQPAAAGGSPHIAGGFEFVKTLAPAPLECLYDGGFFSSHFVRGDCVRVDFNVSGATVEADHDIKLQLRSSDGATLIQEIPESALFHTNGETSWTADIPVDASATPWPPGRIMVRVIADGANAGEGFFFFNALGATVNAGALAPGDRYQPGEDIPVTGSIYELNDIAGTPENEYGIPTKTGVPATFKIRVTDPVGTQLYLSPTLTAAADGTFPAITIPGSATAGVVAGPLDNYMKTLSIQVVEASYTDTGMTPEVPPRQKGTFAGAPAGVGAVTLHATPPTPVIENLYSSPTGWVKPGDQYSWRVFVRNYTTTPFSNVVVTIPAPPSVTYVSATPVEIGTASTAGNAVSWTIATLPASPGTGPYVATLVVTAQAESLHPSSEVVWKDLSTTAQMSFAGSGTADPASLTSSTRGPKVIPPEGGYESARYGDKPFVMVPVDFRDRKHAANHSGEALSRKVNSEDEPGSTLNLYQEMSYGQLFPIGTVPSAGISSKGFEYAPGFDFSQRDPTRVTCRGTTLGDLPDPVEEATYGTPAYPERIKDGWYQLPGDTEYYGGDFPAFTLGVGSTIDGACGETSKSVYDAAQIADPEVNYNDYDLDKDGVVDFFMMVFAGAGGNGDSQLNQVPPYDNIWPHSSSLEYSYTQEGTNLKGYVSDDQLTDLGGVPQCWSGSTYVVYDDCTANGGPPNHTNPVFVRVGPYNVNPEAAIDKASVIAHEYGHHLGLPDYYSTSYTTYNDWNLMATDYSQHMTVFSKQELGWVVPEFLQPNQNVNVSDWEEIKNDTGEIRWQRPDGTFYTLSQANGDQNIHNGESYALKLPRRFLISEEQVEEQASLPNVWYSGRGNDFGCTPVGGHNLDIALPELAELEETATVTLDFKSAFDIEWDWDYGFVMVTTDGENYTSLPSQAVPPTTTPSTYNPNSSGCLETYSNGITGTSGSYDPGSPTFAVDRNPADPIYREAIFIDDQFDLSDYAGQEGVVLRFSYYTDPGLDRPGWFIDDLSVTSGTDVIYESDFTNNEPLRFFPGGCGDAGLRTAQKCTDGWSLIDATTPSNLDHAYYLELRDRSGFDADGQQEWDRTGGIQWAPGVLIEYTDESRGFGNNGGPPPRQHYIDSQPEPGMDCGEALVDDPTTERNDEDRHCIDAAFTAAAGDSHFDDDPNDAGPPPQPGREPGDWVDNFSDPSSPDGLWHFAWNCLSLDVSALSGTDISEDLPSNLSANATIQSLDGCADFAYHGAQPNQPPLADAQARPKVAEVGETFIFDASGSIDDQTPTSQLTYEWDLDNNGSYETPGEVVAHQFMTAGEKTVGLRVTDTGTPALSSTDTVTVLVLATCSPQPFPDVPPTHAFCAEIKWMRDNGIANGYADGQYKPAAVVTRMAMAAFLARLDGATLSACTEPPFPDVPVNHPFCQEIKWMKTAGITTGFQDGTYKPALSVTRQAMSAFMARLAGATLTPCTAPPFEDVPTTHPFCKEIKWMRNTGISTGFEDNTYRPSIDVTRQSMSAFMVRLSLLLD